MQDPANELRRITLPRRSCINLREQYQYALVLRAPWPQVVTDPLSLLKNDSLMIHHLTYKTLSVVPVEETF
jgi:hypothetical protein